MDYLDYMDLEGVGYLGYLYVASQLKELWHHMLLHYEQGQGGRNWGRHVPLVAIETYRTNNSSLFLLGVTITRK